jgi:vancomycin permeability regulator SanA
VIRKIKKLILRFFLLLFGLGFLALAIPRLITALHARPRVFPAQGAPPRRVAVVFGAGLYRSGAPTPVLRDRVEIAAELFFTGKVEKLLMSGDNRFIYYNEPQAMKDYALGLGVPEAAIVLDYAGRSTYDTCYRARAIFGVQDALLVTQGFHLPRALYTCRKLGLEAVGVRADRRTYRRSSLLFWSLRELPATLNAFVDLHLTHPLPVLGRAEPIFPLNSD